MPTSLPPRAAFDGCMLKRKKRQFYSEALPLFSRCLNVTCIALAHQQHSGQQFLTGQDPHNNDDSAAIKELGSGVGKPAAVAEVRCGSRTDDIATHVQSAVRFSMPLLIRGCARSMPAVTRWANDTYLRETGVHGFEELLGFDSGDSSSHGLEQLSAPYTRDTWWPAPFAELLWDFAIGHGSRSLWVSTGAQRAAMHFDTFDNIHVVVGGAKTLHLVSPEYAPHLYYDFAAADAEESSRGADDTVCPSYGGYGCDGLGCFAYVPFDATHVDPRRFPRVADAEVVSVTLQEGDAVVIPALWSHYIQHHPLDGGGRCIALTFTQQHKWEQGATMRPLSVDVQSVWMDRVREREGDAAWRAWPWDRL